MSDESEESTPPESPRVAERCGVLLSVACRATMEEGGSPEDHRGLLRWIADTELDRETEKEEMALLRTPLGGLDPARRAEASWQVEGAAILAWALRLAELPRYDEPVNGRAVAAAIGFRDPHWAHPARAVLRSAAEIERRWNSALAYHWRMVEFRLNRRPLDFSAFADGCWFASLNTEGLDLADGDLLLRGRTLAEAGEDVFVECHGLAGERHRAFEWLVGTHPVWSKVPTDT